MIRREGGALSLFEEGVFPRVRARGERAGEGSGGCVAEEVNVERESRERL
jgi:hypothetical protein